MVVSSPLLITKVKVPAASLREAICHLTLSREPESKDPEVIEPELFQITPLSIASNVKEEVYEAIDILALSPT